MQQVGIVYTLVGPDGLTLTMDGTGDAGSPYFISDISGLDASSLRVSIDELPERDGAAFGRGGSWLGRRSIVITGRIKTDTFTARNTAMANLARASMALRANATLKWQPTGMPAMQIACRREQPLRISGGVVKDFQLSLVAADPLIYSQTLNAQVATAAAAVGAAWPWTYPISWGGGSGAFASSAVVNAGNFATPPIIRVWGYVKDPQLKNAATGEILYLDGLELFAGEYVDVDFASRTAVKNDGTNVYDKVRFPGSVWWALAPGSTTVELRGTSSSAGVEIDVSWRDAWA